MRRARSIAMCSAMIERKPQPAMKGMETKPYSSTHWVWQGVVAEQVDAQRAAAAKRWLIERAIAALGAQISVKRDRLALAVPQAEPPNAAIAHQRRDESRNVRLMGSVTIPGSSNARHAIERTRFGRVRHGT